MNLDNSQTWEPLFAEVYVKSEVDEPDEYGNSDLNPFPVSNGISAKPSTDTYDVKTEIDMKEAETYEGHDELLNDHLDILPMQCNQETLKPSSPLDCQREKNDVQSISSCQNSSNSNMDENLSNMQTVKMQESCPVEDIHKPNMEGDVETPDEYLFPCSVCSYKANNRSMLINHIRGHTSENPSGKNSLCKTKPGAGLKGRCITAPKKLPCNLCSFKTMYISELKRHILIHTGEKPFACEFCPYKASQKSNLKCHLLIHTREKPFACEICSFKANQKTSLRHHLLTHTGEKPFACELCSYKSNRKSCLNRHLSIHGR